MTLREPGWLYRPQPSASGPRRSASRPRPSPDRRRPKVRFAAGVRVMAAAVVVATALTGCAAGQRAQTANEFSVVDGASANLGALGIRNAGITSPTTAVGYAAGASATLSMTVANSGDSADTLVSVTTPNAASATVAGPASAAAALVVPSNASVVFGAGGTATVTLTDLKYRLVPGQLVPVTLTFKDAGQITVQLPVKLVPNQTGGETVDVEPTTAPAI